MRIAFLCVALALATGAAQAATLLVGPGEPYRLPSEAIAAAAPGDTVRIAPGTYADCAVWSTDNLTIEAAGPGVVLRGTVCENRGIFVIQAPNTVIHGITFADAAIAEGNGSGIRDNGIRLTVENCTFRNNQDGILTGNGRDGSLVVRSSVFEGNGACVPNEGCAHAIYAGSLGLVRIEHSRFHDSKVGHHIKSRAWRTEIADNTIEDGPEGTSSYLVDIPDGGALVMTGNILEKGPGTQNASAAITIGEEHAKRTPAELIVSGNTFTNDGPHTVFVRNRTKAPARLSGNLLKGRLTPLTGPGSID